MGTESCAVTLLELLGLLEGMKKLVPKPTAGQLERKYGKPLAVSPDGSLKAYPNGYAAYHTPDGDTVVWIGGCLKYQYPEDAKGKKPEPISKETFTLFPWYVAVALVGEDAVSRNVLDRKGDREGHKSEERNGRDEGKAVKTEERNAGMKYESPECAVIRKEQVKLMLEQLSPMQKKTLVLHDVYGYNEVEIAAIYTEWRAKRGDMRKYSKSCVSKHLNNAKFRLRYRKVPF